jgi:SRSO17 transposase
MIAGVVTDLVVGELDRVHALIAGRFARSEPRVWAREYVSGLAAGLERKNGWTLAERAGEASPDGMQRLLRWADWDIDGVRDDLRAYVAERLGEPDGVLIADETGFLKKGTARPGCSGSIPALPGGRRTARSGVFLAYASGRGHTLIDRELYLPASWTDGRDRCRAAGIPDEAQFSTKARLAERMLAQALDAGCRSRGSPLTRSTARPSTCAPGWKTTACPM